MYVYDCEVFAHDWIIVAKKHNTKDYIVIHNDGDVAKELFSQNEVFTGFNSKHYDQYIIKAVCAGFAPEEVKSLNDYLIYGQNGWEYPYIKDCKFWFNNCDIRDDMQQGLSLKSIEGHLGLNIKESTVSFDLDRPLSESELQEVVKYCKHDVDCTEILINERQDYLNTKITLGKMVGLSEEKSLSMTNAKLTAAMLQATYTQHDDERNYVYPNNLLREYIPKEVFDFFDRLHDNTVKSDEIFSEKLSFTIGRCCVTIRYGGIHGAIPNFEWSKLKNKHEVIVNVDVDGYYPHLCVINGYTSRNIPSPKIYEYVLEERMKAKRDGDKDKSNALKLVCNTSYGATLNKYNPLYDPLMGRSVCISGQLYLLELSEHCFLEIPDIEIVQLNTDGMMVKLPENQVAKLQLICEEWQKRTKFTLESDYIDKISQKDVNNYIEVKIDGTVKSKGGYLVRGTSTTGAYNINNNMKIVAKAIANNLIYDIPVEDTILQCNDILEFQQIAKAGSKYEGAFQLVNGEKVPVQKVNRVYASKNENYGCLYKVKKENGSIAKIEMLPEHCVIDNENVLSIEDIDKSFYIDIAKKRVQDFKGGNIMPNSKVNVYEKLLNARLKLLQSGMSKTGKNMHLQFKYFELEDIVPKVTQICQEERLLILDSFSENTAVATVINIDEPSDVIEFKIPYATMNEIVSAQKGASVVNDIQRLGASVTYLRRYLYMIIMDICESDNIDAGYYDEQQTKEKKEVKLSAANREEAKAKLTNTNAKADILQIKSLTALLSKLLEVNPEQSEFVEKLAKDTNGFEALSKKDCETLISSISNMIKESE